MASLMAASISLSLSARNEPAMSCAGRMNEAAASRSWRFARISMIQQIGHAQCGELVQTGLETCDNFIHRFATFQRLAHARGPEHFVKIFSVKFQFVAVLFFDHRQNRERCG